MMHQDHAGQTSHTWWRALLPIIIASITLIMLLSINAAITPIHAAPNANALVRVDPLVVHTATTAISVPVDIRIENVNGLYGADVQLTFDPALLAVQDANSGQAGIQIGLGPLLTSGGYFVVINTADNVSGTARLALTQLNPTLPVTGSGVLAHITFKPVGPAGTSQIHFTKADLATRTGAQIPATVQDGTIEIQPVPVDLSRSTKRASAETVGPTSQLTYTLVLTNWGGSVASGVTLTDALPISTSYVPGSLSGNGATFDPVQNQIKWSGSVPASGSVTLSYAVIINATGFATIVNRAYISINQVPDRILAVETQVTPSGNPLKRVYLPLIIRNF